MTFTRRSFPSVLIIGFVLHSTIAAKTDTYPISGAWTLLENLESKLPSKSCASYLHSSKGVVGNLIVFSGSKKTEYNGGYLEEETVSNLSAYKIGANEFQIVDQFYDDGEGSEPGYKKRRYRMRIENGRLSIFEGSNPPSIYIRCQDKDVAPTTNAENLPYRQRSTQQRYSCPPLEHGVLPKIVSNMRRIAEAGNFKACSNNGSIDCGLVIYFQSEIRSFRKEYSSWSAIVNCFPELAPIKSINEQGVAKKAALAKEKIEAAEKARQEQQAKDNDPKHMLTRTYYDYSVVRKCFNQRQGYLSVNISSEEMERAKKAAKGIEEVILKNNSSIDKDVTWNAANSDSSDWMTETDKAELMVLGLYNDSFKMDFSARNRCQNILQALETRFKKIAPAQSAPKKDF